MSNLKQLGRWVKKTVRDPELRKGVRSQCAFAGLMAVIAVAAACLTPSGAHADFLPGDDVTSKMSTLGSGLRLLDTVFFVWCARIASGSFAALGFWNFGHQRPARGSLGLVAALGMAFLPNIVKDCFSASGANGVFSTQRAQSQAIVAVLERAPKATLLVSWTQEDQCTTTLS